MTSPEAINGFELRVGVEGEPYLVILRTPEGLVELTFQDPARFQALASLLETNAVAFWDEGSKQLIFRG